MIRFCASRPRFVLALVLLATAASALAAARVSVDPSVESMLPGSAADGIYYERFLERFGSDEVVFVALRGPHPYGAASLSALARISAGLREISLEPAQPGGARVPLVDLVVSPASVVEPRAGRGVFGEPTVVVEPLVQALPQTEAEERDLWERATRDPLLVRNLVSPPTHEGPAAVSTLLIVARIVDRPGDLTYRGEVTRQVRALIDEELARDPSLEATASVAGVPIVKTTVAELTLSQLFRLEPLAWAANAIIVLLMFRSLRVTALALLVAGTSLLWTLGLLTLLGKPLNILSIVVFELVKALAVATSIHVLSGYRMLASTGGQASEVAAAAAERAAWPSFLSTATTSLGCLGLAFSGIDPMRDVGVYSAFGLMVGWILSMTLLPALLALFPGNEIAAPPPWIGPRIGDALVRLVEPALRRPAWTVVAVLALTSLAVLGVTRLRVESSVMTMLDPSDPLRIATDRIGDEVAGIQTLEISLRTAPGHALDPDLLARVEKLQEWLESQPRIDKTISIVDYLKRASGVLETDGPEGARLPETAQVLRLLAENGDTNDPIGAWLQPSWEEPTHLRVTVRSRIYSAEDTTALVAATRAYLAEKLRMHDDVTAREEISLAPGQIAGGMTGVLVLFANTRDVLLRGQGSSWLIAIAVIWMALVAAMRSIRIGTLAMIPNTLPSILMFGLMGWFGIPLDIATGLTAAIYTAISDDDTIHLLSGYRLRIAGGKDRRVAIRESIREVGPVILLAACVLAAGFFTFFAATFGPLFNFGLLAGTAAFAGVLFDLILLPALLLLGGRDEEESGAQPC